MSELDVNAPAAAAWRTIIAVAFISTLQAAAFAYGSHRGWTMEGAAAFGSLCTCSTGLGLGVAVKALGEHLGNGSGIKGALSALVSDTKPGDPAPGKQP